MVTRGPGPFPTHCTATLQSTGLLSCSDARNLRCLGTSFCAVLSSGSGIGWTRPSERPRDMRVGDVHPERMGRGPRSKCRRHSVLGLGKTDWDTLRALAVRPWRPMRGCLRECSRKRRKMGRQLDRVIGVGRLERTRLLTAQSNSEEMARPWWPELQGRGGSRTPSRQPAGTPATPRGLPLGKSDDKAKGENFLGLPSPQVECVPLGGTGRILSGQEFRDCVEALGMEAWTRRGRWTPAEKQLDHCRKR